VEIAGRPRSLAEMLFVAGLLPCSACGDHRPVEWHAGGRGATWTLRGACPRCATQHSFEFICDCDPIAAPHAELELGGGEPSTVLDPHTLVLEIDRLMPTIAVRPGVLGDPQWSANWARLVRLRIALNELAKFLPAGAQAIAVDGAAERDQRQRPERYARAWIEAERARWAQIAEQLAADFARIAAADPILSRPTRPRGRIDKLAIQNHARWLARRRTGLGRLDVVTTDARGRDLSGANLAACHIEGAWFHKATLEVARFDRAELTDVDFTQASLAATSFAGAALHSCAFDQARLQNTSWRSARVTETRLRDALLVEARLDGAMFSGCDLRGGSLRGAWLAGAVFERCDLRGVIFTGADLNRATFRACKVAGARGKPATIDGWTVIDADFSDTGDGSDLGDAEDLLAELCA
jgi:uncharacterized protein YjbI with pentapeptide repeats